VLALTGHHIIIISDPAFGWSLSEGVESWQWMAAAAEVISK